MVKRSESRQHQLNQHHEETDLDRIQDVFPSDNLRLHDADPLSPVCGLSNKKNIRFLIFFPPFNPFKIKRRKVNYDDLKRERNPFKNSSLPDNVFIEIHLLFSFFSSFLCIIEERITSHQIISRVTIAPSFIGEVFFIIIIHLFFIHWQQRRRSVSRRNFK